MELPDGAFDDAFWDEISVAAEINTALWRYPAKLVLALSFLPDLCNLAVISLTAVVNAGLGAAGGGSGGAAGGACGWPCLGGWGG